MNKIHGEVNGHRQRRSRNPEHCARSCEHNLQPSGHLTRPCRHWGRPGDLLSQHFTMLKVTFKRVQVNKSPSSSQHVWFNICFCPPVFLQWASAGLMAFLSSFVCCSLSTYVSTVKLCWGPIWLHFDVPLPETAHCWMNSDAESTQLQRE